MLRVPDREDVEEDETVGLALKLQKKVRNHQSEQSVETGMMPDFNWREEEQIEFQKALATTVSWKRYLDEGPETQGLDESSRK